MAGKITTVLTKKEAETYRSQGLHREALNLYNSLLSSSPNIDPAIRSAIQDQIQGIHREMRDVDNQRQRPLTRKEIITIRDGWGEKATETDLLVCAQAFFQIGSFMEALAEFKKLLCRKYIKRIYVTAAADCLVRLHAPERLPEVAENFAKVISQTPKTILAIQVAMARHMEARQHSAHALALYRHLQDIPALTHVVQTRIDQLEPKI